MNRGFFGGLGLLIALTFASVTGCKKSESNTPPAPPASSALSPDTIARVHWLGKKRLGLEATAYYFCRIWDLPESKRLEAQTLDKLSTAPWRLLSGETATPTASNPALRPLLDDLVQEESCIEVRQPTNQTAQAVFAIRLNPQRAGVWVTNLAVALESLMGGVPATATPSGRGWSLQRREPPMFIEMTRVGEWTLVGAARDQNTLLAELVGRIRRQGVPFVATPTNYWLEAEVDLKRLAAVFPDLNESPLNRPAATYSPTGGVGRDEGAQLRSGAALPRISISVTGDGANVIARGEMAFPKPLAVTLDPWVIPTNLVHEPLLSFTAIRGVKFWVESSKIWSDLQIGPPPNQVYFWTLQGGAFPSYFAAPMPDAGNQVRRFTDYLIEKGNPWLAARGYVSFERSPGSNGSAWGNMSSIQPFFRSVDTASGGFVFGGLLPDTGAEANPPPSAGMIQDVLRRTNLVYYDWEITGSRIEPCLYLGQAVRQVARFSQLPLDSASAIWLSPLVVRLGTTATIVTLKQPDQLAFVRKSTLGLTAAELHLLADWLESPQFPHGLHSLSPPADTPAP